MKIITNDGRSIDAEDIDFDTNKEEWNEYKLNDGTILRIKSVLNSVIRTSDYDPMTGDPAYIVKSTNIIKVVVPDKLKKLPAFRKSSGVEIH